MVFPGVVLKFHKDVDLSFFLSWKPSNPQSLVLFFVFHYFLTHTFSVLFSPAITIIQALNLLTSTLKCFSFFPLLFFYFFSLYFLGYFLDFIFQSFF